MAEVVFRKRQLKKSRNTEAKELDWFSVCMLEFHYGQHNDGEKDSESGAKGINE